MYEKGGVFHLPCLLTLRRDCQLLNCNNLEFALFYGKPEYNFFAYVGIVLNDIYFRFFVR